MNTNRRSFFALIGATVAAPAVTAKEPAMALAYRETGHTFYKLPNHSVTALELITQAMRFAGVLAPGQVPSFNNAHLALFNVKLMLLGACKPDRQLQLHGIVPVPANNLMPLHDALVERLRRAYNMETAS